MKRIFKLVVFLSLALLAPALVKAAQIQTISAPFVTVGVGDTFTVPVSITDTPDLTSWQFDLAFDPSIVNADSVTEGPLMSSFGMTSFGPGVIDNTSGLISLVTDSYVDLPPDPSGSGVLADVDFTALAPGVSPLTLQNVFLNLSDTGFDIANGQITVTGSAVPEPTTLMLLASGIVLLGALRLVKGVNTMKHARLYVIGLMLLGMIGFSTGPAVAATAAGPYYAMPSWDQQLPASTRFIVLSNWIDKAHPSGGAAVLDRETGLVWEQSPDTFTYEWSEAEFNCATSNTGGRLGWRLPTIQELTSLLDPTQSYPALPSGHPFSNVQPEFYWSATDAGTVADCAWGVYFSNGTVDFDNWKGLTGHLWCVRGGQGVNPQ